MDILDIRSRSYPKQDEAIYRQWFEFADADSDGRLTGNDAVRSFSLSQLPRDQLKQVWAVADSKRQGFLGFKEFVTAMQIVSLAQTGNEITADILKERDVENISPPVMEGLEELLRKGRHAILPTEPDSSVRPTVETASWFASKSTKKVSLSKVTSIIDGLKRLYIEKLKPLEVSYLFSDFCSPLLTNSDFDAKPMVMLLGQYSTGKTTFIKHLLKSSYPGAHIGPEPTTDRFVVVMV